LFCRCNAEEQHRPTEEGILIDILFFMLIVLGFLTTKEG